MVKDIGDLILKYQEGNISKEEENSLVEQCYYMTSSFAGKAFTNEGFRFSIGPSSMRIYFNKSKFEFDDVVATGVCRIFEHMGKYDFSRYKPSTILSAIIGHSWRYHRKINSTPFSLSLRDFESPLGNEIQNEDLYILEEINTICDTREERILNENYDEMNYNMRKYINSLPKGIARKDLISLFCPGSKFLPRHASHKKSSTRIRVKERLLEQNLEFSDFV